MQPLSSHRHLKVLLFTTAMTVGAVLTQKVGDIRLMHEWLSVDFDWPSESARQAAVADGSYVPERNIPTTAKTYRGEVFMAIPRWRWNSGHPATLVKVVRVDGQDKLRPFPDWQSQKQGDCNMLQSAISMEIDPNTGLMYVIDIGRTGFLGSVEPRNLCPAKIVVIDLNSDTITDVHELSDNHVSRTSNCVNDIVLDYVDNQVRYAYISDTVDSKLFAYDFLTRTTATVDHSSMKAEGDNGSVITINGQDYLYMAGINGIAMSPDFDYVYYSPLGSYNLYQIPTFVLRKLLNSNPVSINAEQELDLSIRLAGRKISQSDGMAHGQKRLYFGALQLNSVYFWDIERDMRMQELPRDRVQMRSQVQLARNDLTMQWPDSLSFDGLGWLWFISSRVHLFSADQMDFSGADGNNFRVWKIFVNETSYLQGAGGGRGSGFGNRN